MALTADILESWRHPRVVIRRLAARGRSEPFVLSFLFVFLLLAFTARAPSVARDVAVNPAGSLYPSLFGVALGMLALIPVFYLMAALGHLVAKLMGGTGGYYDGRLALFWALTCTAPAMLLAGLIHAFAHNSLAVSVVDIAVFLIFLTLYIAMLTEVEGA